MLVWGETADHFRTCENITMSVENIQLVIKVMIHGIVHAGPGPVVQIIVAVVRYWRRNDRKTLEMSNGN